LSPNSRSCGAAKLRGRNMEIDSPPKNALQGLGEYWINVHLTGVRLVKVVTPYTSLLWPILS